MYVAFEQLADDARIWIYQANRKFSDAEVFTLKKGLQEFIENWTAHDKDLEGSYLLVSDQFIALAVNDSVNKATGCSIDKSVNFMQIIEQEFQVSLFNRELVSYFEADEPVTVDRSEFEALLSKGQIQQDTLVINNLVFTKGEFIHKWKLPYTESWHEKVFGALTV